MMPLSPDLVGVCVFKLKEFARLSLLLYLHDHATRPHVMKESVPLFPLLIPCVVSKYQEQLHTQVNY